MGIFDFFKRWKGDLKKGSDFSRIPYGYAIKEYSTLSFNEDDVEKLESNLVKISKYNPWIGACVRAITENSIRPVLKIRNKDSLIDVDAHPFYEIMQRPNQFQSFNQMFRSLIYDYCFDGNAYLLKIRVRGKVKGYQSIPFMNVRVNEKYSRDSIMASGKYEYSILLGGKSQGIPNEDIFHWKDTTFSNAYKKGYSKLKHLLYSVSEQNYIDRFNLSFVKNGGKPSGILLTKQPVTAQAVEDIRERWDKSVGGMDNAGRLAVIGNARDVDYIEAGKSTSEMGYEVLKKVSREEILAVFRVPPVLVGLTESVNYANAKEQRKIFFEVNIIPMLTDLNKEMNSLLIEDFGDTENEFYFDYSNITELQEDLSEKMKVGVLAMTYFGFPAKEVVEKLDLPFDTNTLPKPSTEEEVTVEEETETEGAGQEGEMEQEEVEEVGEEGKGNQGINLQNVPIEDTIGYICEKCGNWIEPVGEKICDKCGYDNSVWIDESEKNGQIEKETPSISIPKTYIEAMREKAKESFLAYHSQPEKWYANKVDKHFLSMRNDLFDWLKTFGKSLSKDENYDKELLLALDRYIKKVKGGYQKDLENITMQMYSRASKEVVERMVDLYGLAYKETLEEYFIYAQNVKHIADITNRTYQEIRKIAKDTLAQGYHSSTVANVLKDNFSAIFKKKKHNVATIARTETTAITNSLEVYQFKENGIEKASWLTAQDEVVRETHQALDGEVIRLGVETFSNGLSYPGDMSTGNGAEVINCRCSLFPIIE